MSSWCFPEVPRKVYAIARKRPNYLRKLPRKAFHGQPPARKVFDGYAQGARKVWHMHWGFRACGRHMGALGNQPHKAAYESQTEVAAAPTSSRASTAS